ncbi:MAG: hypothetical protein RR397_11275 [Odoribacter sp.]
MDITKIKFFDTETKMIIESNISRSRVFREMLNVTPPPGFSDISAKPNHYRYKPIMPTGKKDSNDVELYDGDIVEFNYSMFRGDEYDNKIRCKVVYNAEEAMYCIDPIEPHNDAINVPLFGLKDEITKIGSIYLTK